MTLTRFTKTFCIYSVTQGVDRMTDETVSLTKQKSMNARLQEALKNELRMQRGEK